MRNGDTPAFPNSFIDKSVSGINHTIVVDGLTKRQYAAIEMAKGLLASGIDDTNLPLAAIDLADRLLSELEKVKL